MTTSLEKYDHTLFIIKYHSLFSLYINHVTQKYLAGSSLDLDMYEKKIFQCVAVAAVQDI
jgi:hypothetical protein